VLYHPDPGNRRCLREIDAGMEEEGVPFRIEEAVGGSAGELAYAAAQASNLDVGVGVDAVGNICVHHAKLPSDVPALVGSSLTARAMFSWSLRRKSGRLPRLRLIS